jgi:acyl-[acyl-carrier-protein]-phospholipid O-acyltransferase / long-chain-fatty-acid--[acyl-carrier-protein] ligase
VPIIPTNLDGVWGSIFSFERGRFLWKMPRRITHHIRIEEKLHDLAGVTEQVFAVTALADDKKGERIVVLTTLPAEQFEPVVQRLAQSDLPALWKPKSNQFFHADALPMLGTGKMDLRGVKALAASLTQPVEA